MMTLLARAPLTKDTARIRFSVGKSLLSQLIIIEQDAQFAHAEAVLADGTIITSLLGIGVKRYPNDEWYNAGTTCQQFVDLPMSPDQYTNWCNYLYGIIDSKFDNEGALGVLFGMPIHCAKEFVCSMVVMSSLATPSVGWCSLDPPDRVVSPTQLLQFLSMDTRATVYPPESENTNAS